MRMPGHSPVQSHKKYISMDTRTLWDVLTGCIQEQTEKMERASKSA
jgi:hypothetical protein